jgi:hypothetical protein
MLMLDVFKIDSIRYVDILFYFHTCGLSIIYVTIAL